MANPDASKSERLPLQRLVSGNGTSASNHQSYSKAVSEMENAVVELCNMLSHSPEAGMDCDEWIDLLGKYIAEHRNRIYYSAISNCVFKMNEQQFSDFLSNMGEVVDYATEHIQQDKTWQTRNRQNLYRTIIKFYDHANLAHQQQVTFSSKKEALREDVKSEVKATLEPRISEISKEMTSQLVGLVSIFTALSFIVFGGISSLKNMVTSLQGTLKDQQSILPILILAMAWAFCMMNLLFGFMYFVIRITHLQKPVDENATNVVQRYPVVFLCDYIILALLVLFSGMWFAKTSGVGKGIYKLWVEDCSDKTFIIATSIFIIAFGALAAFLLKLYKPPQHPKKSRVLEKLKEYLFNK